MESWLAVVDVECRHIVQKKKKNKIMAFRELGCWRVTLPLFRLSEPTLIRLADGIAAAPCHRTVSEGLRALTEYTSAARAWGSWGPADLCHMEQRCAALGITVPALPRHLDLQAFVLPWLLHLGLVAPVSDKILRDREEQVRRAPARGKRFRPLLPEAPALKTALRALGVAVEGPLHHGLSDAEGAARVLHVLYERCGAPFLAAIEAALCGGGATYQLPLPLAGAASSQD